MAEFPAPTSGIALTSFIVSSDVERSRRMRDPDKRLIEVGQLVRRPDR